LDQQGETVDKLVPQVMGLGLWLALFVWQAAIATDERKLSFLVGCPDQKADLDMD
jgi:hypothetical protein